VAVAPTYNRPLKRVAVTAYETLHQVSLLRPVLESARRRYRRMMKMPLLDVDEIRVPIPALPPPPPQPLPRPVYRGRTDRHIVLLHNINVIQECRLALEEFSRRIGVASVQAAVLGVVQKDLEKQLEQSKPEDPKSLQYVLEMSARAVSDNDLARLASLVKPILADAEKRGLDQLGSEGTICALLFDALGDYRESQGDIESAFICYQKAFALDNRLTYSALKVCRILQHSGELYQALLWASKGIDSPVNTWAQVMPTVDLTPARTLLAKHLSVLAGLDSGRPSHSTMVQSAETAID
jgi:hypothetical protein